jgi:hypothetical protein
MGGNRSRLRRLTLSVALAVSLMLALPAFASAARVLYADGHPIDLTRLATFGGNSVVDPGNGQPPQVGFDGCSDSEWASALARTDFDVLIVGENAPRCGTPLSADTMTAIGNYVRNGKPIVLTGAHGDEDDFLNALFGFSTIESDSDSSEALFGSIQPGATGTRFAGGPPTLTTPSQTNLLAGTPGTTIYFGPEGVYVFTVPFGSGVVTYLAWDLCGEPDDCGNTASVEDDWYRVVDSAVHVRNAFTIDAIRRNKKKGTATITGSVPFSGELVGSGKGVKASSAGDAVISKSVGAGPAKLVIKAKGKKRKKLNRKGKAKVKVAITYTATGGSPTTQSVKVKLKKKLKKE